MRSLGPIVGILLGIVGNTWQDGSTGSTIAFQLVGDDPEWLLALTAQQSAKEPLGLIQTKPDQAPTTIYKPSKSGTVRITNSCKECSGS